MSSVDAKLELDSLYVRVVYEDPLAKLPTTDARLPTTRDFELALNLLGNAWSLPSAPTVWEHRTTKRWLVLRQRFRLQLWEQIGDDGWPGGGEQPRVVQIHYGSPASIVLAIGALPGVAGSVWLSLQILKAVFALDIDVRTRRAEAHIRLAEAKAELDWLANHKRMAQKMSRANAQLELKPKSLELFDEQDL